MREVEFLQILALKGSLKNHLSVLDGELVEGKVQGQQRV